MPWSMPEHKLIDKEQHRLLKSGTWHELTKTEWKFFVCLCRYGKRLTTKEKLYDFVYGNRPDGGPDKRVLDAYMTHLRRKCPFKIDTVHGEGYILHDYSLVWKDVELPKPNAVKGITKSRLMSGK